MKCRSLILLIILFTAITIPTITNTATLNITRITTQAYIDKGYIIAPHMYYVLLKSGDKITFDNIGPVFKPKIMLGINLLCKYEQSNGWFYIHSGSVLYGFYWGWYDSAIKYEVRNDTSKIGYVNPLSVHEWHNLTMMFDDAGYMYVYEDGVLETTVDGTTFQYPEFVGNVDLLIGSDAVNKSAEISYFIAENFTGERLIFFDPTFYNGTHYFDLLNSSLVGVPYGGVERVEDEEKWLWVVQDAVNDDYVHLKFMPVNSVVKFYNATSGELLVSYTITGTANDAGLVEDYPIPLPEGNYTIELVIAEPLEISYNLQFTGSNLLTNITATRMNYTLNISHSNVFEKIGKNYGEKGICLQSNLKVYLVTENDTQLLFEHTLVNTHPSCLIGPPEYISNPQEPGWSRDVLERYGTLIGIVLPLALGLILSYFYGMAALFMVLPVLIYYSRVGIIPSWVGVMIMITLFLAIIYKMKLREEPEAE